MQLQPAIALSLLLILAAACSPTGQGADEPSPSVEAQPAEPVECGEDDPPVTGEAWTVEIELEEELTVVDDLTLKVSLMIDDHWMSPPDPEGETASVMDSGVSVFAAAERGGRSASLRFSLVSAEHLNRDCWIWDGFLFELEEVEETTSTIRVERLARP